MSFIADGQGVFDIEIEALKEVRSRMDGQFDIACALIRNC